MRLLCLVLLALLPQDKSQVDIEIRDDAFAMPPDLMMRARVTAITPSEPTTISWRWGGEGLGGNVFKGVFGENLAVGTWSPQIAVASLVKGKFPGKLFLTVMAGHGGKRGKDRVTEGQSTNVDLEFEFAWQGKVVKTFSESGPDGGTVGMVIPANRLTGGKTPASPEFLNELSGLLDYAKRRSAKLQAISEGPRPSKFSIVTNCGGYGAGHAYGVRYTNKSVLEAEIRGLQALGVNGLTGETPNSFTHVAYAQLGGYPVPSAKAGTSVPEAGCPFAPGVAARTKAMIDQGLATALQMKVDEVWWRTEDEIGSVADRSSEGKAHFAKCETCVAAFRAWLREQGVPNAAEARPVDPTIKGEAPTRMTYYTAMFANYASAKLFTPVRDALAKANEEKRKNPSLKQPFVYSFALRGNTFLMGGHSLDFFDFYRHADNAMVYETSNRDARIWGWDSYLCDVGRILSPRMKTEFGVYVKPHRGAPIQRALAAASRGSKLIYWYTYGPDYVKGDSFAESDSALEATARAAAILGKAEDLLYGASYAAAPEIAVVNPRSSEIWNKVAGGSPAPYENAKWIYTALTHAHLPVDPLDEVMVATEDLSRYKVIYVSGTHLTAAAAEKLAAWVLAGGTLYTSGGGLARDEGNQPLSVITPVLALQNRGPVELWSKVQAYGATALEVYAGSGPEISGPAGKFAPVVGREPLKAAVDSDVVAKFSDGAAALVRHAAGKGQVWVAGFFPGLEYSAGVRTDEFDMSRDFDPVRRSYVTAAALDRVKPVVDASQPLVEGILLRNEAGKRAVTLMNWAYRVTAKGGKKSYKGIVPFKDVKVAIRGVGEVTKVTSTVLNQPLKIEKTADGITVVLPELREGDVLRLE